MPSPSTTTSKKQPTKTKSTSPKFVRAVGRRKTAVARVRLLLGKEENLINDLPVAKYFPDLLNETNCLAPLRTTNLANKYYITVKVAGGGKQAQAQAVAHGIARALIKQDTSLKPILKKKGLLTRDPRMKERRKAGFAQKARARKQSPKR